MCFPTQCADHGPAINCPVIVSWCEYRLPTLRFYWLWSLRISSFPADWLAFINLFYTCSTDCWTLFNGCYFYTNNEGTEYLYTVFEWGKRRTGTLCLRTPKAWGDAPYRRESSIPKARGISMQLGDLGGDKMTCCKLPSGSERCPAAKQHLVHFLVWKCFIWRRPSRAIVNAYLQKLPTNCAKSFSCQTDSSAKNQFSLPLSHLAIGRSKFSPLLICGKVIPLPLEVGPLKSS